MGGVGSCERKGAGGAAGLEGAVFQQRCNGKAGPNSAAAQIKQEESFTEDFLDISYSEGGGIVSPKVRQGTTAAKGLQWNLLLE